MKSLTDSRVSWCVLGVVLSLVGIRDTSIPNRYKRFWDAVKGKMLDCSHIFGPKKVTFTTVVEGTFLFNISYTESKPSGAPKAHQVSVITDGREGWNYGFRNRHGFYEFKHKHSDYIVHLERVMIDIYPDYSMEEIAPFGHGNTLLGLPAVQ